MNVPHHCQNVDPNTNNDCFIGAFGSAFHMSATLYWNDLWVSALQHFGSVTYMQRHCSIDFAFID